jgi:RluA family pseudouridine synthase
MWDRLPACQTPVTGTKAVPLTTTALPNPVIRPLAERHAAILRVCSPLPGSVPRDNYKSVNVPGDCDGRTLLDALCHMVKNVTVAAWLGEFALGRLVDLAQQPVSPAQIVRMGERYRHQFPGTVEPGVNGRVEILYEDEALIVVNKPAPLPMHAGGRFYRNTLQYIINEVYRPEKPHPAHRLDANTTGLVLVTRSRHFAGRLQPQFAGGRVEKRYLVRVQGRPAADAFACDAPISARSGELGSRTVDWAAGQTARTEFTVCRRLADGTTLLEARPLTGRTNQIRVHLWHLGFPVCGDPVYLPGQTLGATQTLHPGDPPLCLHAWQIKFRHPLTHQPAEFTAPPPDHLLSAPV